VPDVDLLNLEEDSIIDSFWTECVFFWSEEHARIHRKNSHRIRGAYMRVDQMVQVTRIIQSAIFGFDMKWFEDDTEIQCPRSAVLNDIIINLHNGILGNERQMEWIKRKSL
jgi:hypothetical protein